MVHFNFIVDNEEASTIFECLTHEITDTKEQIINMYNQNTPAEVEWFKDRLVYLEELVEKMHHERT